MEGDACGNRAPTEVTPRSSTRNSLSSRTRGATLGDRRLSVGSLASRRWSRVVADHRGARGGRRDDDVEAGERVGEAADERDARRLVAAVEVHLAAARLRLRELDLVAEVPEQPDRRLPDLREEQVVEAGDEQPDAHQAAPRLARQPTSRDAAPGLVRLEPPQVVGGPDERPQRLEVARDQPARPGLDEDVADGGRLDRAGDHRPPAESAVSWHSSSLRAPPPTRWIVVTSIPDSRVASSTARA